jgi:flagellar basal body-associated protein FliL
MRKSTPVQTQAPQQEQEQAPVPRVEVKKKKKAGKAGTIFVFILFLIVAVGCGTVGFMAYNRSAQTSLEIAGLTDIEETTEEETEFTTEEETETETDTEEATEELMLEEADVDMEDVYREAAVNIEDKLNNSVQSFFDANSAYPDENELIVLVEINMAIDYTPNEEMAVLVNYDEESGSIANVTVMSIDDEANVKDNGHLDDDMIHYSMTDEVDYADANIVGIYEDSSWSWDNF